MSLCNAMIEEKKKEEKFCLNNNNNDYYNREEEEEEEGKKNRRKMEDKGLKINNNRVTRESHTLFSPRKSLANLLSSQLKLNHYTLL